MKTLDDLDVINYGSFINNWMIDLFLKTVIGVTGDNTLGAKYDTEFSDFDPAIAMQFYYNADTNRCYIELRLNGPFRDTYAEQLELIKNRFSSYIAKNLRSETTVWPELVLPQNKIYEVCDESNLVTPFTIGYWKSLAGRYTFVEDKVKILKDYNDLVFPEYDPEYLEKAKQIYDDYYTEDFDAFIQKMYELNTEYDIRLDTPPRKDFREFIDDVEELNMQYHQVMLSNEEMAQYIHDYMVTIVTFKDDEEELKLALSELYDEYHVVRNLADKVPEIFELYKQKYAAFFEKELVTFEITHPDDNAVEVWTYEGDFDFGDLDEGIDPDNVAVRDYEYNYASNFIVFNSHYDIIPIN